MRHNIARMRQLITRENDPQPGISIATHSRDYEGGSRVPLHAHGSDQLVYAGRGVMKVSSGQNLWMIPPHFGLWIPACTEHEIYMPERVSMRTLYLRPALSRVSASCAVLHVGSFLRELILEIVRVGQLRQRNRVECALRVILVSELQRATPVPSLVRLPRDPRAGAVAQAMLENPAIRTPLKAICATAGVSVRTLQRIFLKEVGTDFEYWRRQVRLMKAIELLAAGRSVKEVAFAVGYQHPSAFVALFRSTFATTPKAWIAALDRVN